MSCDCMKRILDAMNIEFKYNFPFAETIGKVTFKNERFWRDKDGDLKPLIAIPMVSWMKAGNVNLKIETEVWPTYCPFCGKIRNDIMDEGGEK